MLKNAPTHYLLNFYTVTLLVLTTLSYAIIFVILNTQRIETSERVFEQIRYDLIDNLNHNNLNLEQVSARLIKQNKVSHRVMVMTPSGLPLVNSFYREDQLGYPFFTLPHWGYADGMTESYSIDSKQLLGWASLPNNYQAYIQIIHPPLIINWLNPIYWLPLIIAIILLSYNLFLIMRHKKAWTSVIDYSSTFSSRLDEPYEPIYTKPLKVNQEFQRLANSLNRINQKLHHNHRHISTLNKRLLRLTDYSPLPLFFVNKQGKISYFNKRFEQSFMTAFHENITYFITDFVIGKDKETQRSITKLSELRTSKTFHVTSLEGTTHYLLHLHPWIGQQSQVQGFSAVLTNISHLAYELSDSEKKVYKQAEKLVEFDKLWSVLGHELRTPLSSMISLIELMDHEGLNDEQIETWETIVQTSHTMLNILNDMLDSAKIEAGRLKVISERTDILALSHQTTDLMSNNARLKNIELLLFFDSNCPRYIDTDSIRIQQILMNLVGNAIKFTSSGYVALRVLFLRSDSPKLLEMINTTSLIFDQKTNTPWVCFRVEDTGIGINDDEKSRLFSYFNQANDSIARQFGGTGLGLAISNRFAQLLGGFIHVSSTVGKGSEFSLCLPISQTSHHSPAYPIDRRLSSIHLIAFSSQKVSAEALLQLAHHLNITCYAYTGITDEGLQTLSRYENPNSPTILLVDHELYIKDDMQRLKNNRVWQTLPKILISMQVPNTIEPDQREAFDAIITKPLIVAELMQVLNKLIDLKHAPFNHIPVNPVQLHRTQLQPTLHTKTYFNRSSKAIPSNIISQSVSTSSTTVNNDFKTGHDFFNIGKSQPTTASINIENKFKMPKALHHKPIILIAEDNLVNQRIVCAILDNLGYTSIAVNNGKEALQVLKDRQDIDLVLMDCRMPVMDGIETTRFLRAENNTIPIVALTANTSVSDREECLDAGMNDFITKPIRQNDLAKILKQLIR